MFTRLSFSIAMATVSLFGTTALATESVNPLQIFVSKDSQSLVVYDDSLNLLGSVFIDGFPTSLTEDAQGLAVAWTTCVPDIDACIPDKNLNGHLRPTAGGFELVEDPGA